MNPIIKKTLLATSVTLALGVPTAHASLQYNIYGADTWSTSQANFTMLSSGGYIVGGTNDVSMTWDGNAYNASSDYTGPGLPGSGSNVTASSTTVFFSHLWTAHDIQVFEPGSYSFPVALGGPNLNVTVPSGDLGMHMLFNWNNNNNIDVFVVAAPGQVFGAGIASTTNTGCTTSVKNCLWTGKGYLGGKKSNAPSATQVWMLTSVVNGSSVGGVPGVPMPAGPFVGFNANFNANLTPTPKVPLPAAVWLFGSGLMGLAAVARRKKKA